MQNNIVNYNFSPQDAFKLEKSESPFFFSNKVYDITKLEKQGKNLNVDTGLSDKNDGLVRLDKEELEFLKKLI
jgi:hypothetical protein